MNSLPVIITQDEEVDLTMEDLTIEETEEEDDETMATTAQEGPKNSNFQGSISNKKLVQKDYRTYSFVNYYIQKKISNTIKKAKKSKANKRDGKKGNKTVNGTKTFKTKPSQKLISQYFSVKPGK